MDHLLSSDACVFVLVTQERLKARGHIYKGRYEGWYSVSDETFVGEDQVKEVIEGNGKTKKVRRRNPENETRERISESQRNTTTVMLSIAFIFMIQCNAMNYIEIFDVEKTFVQCSSVIKQFYGCFVK